DLVRGEDEAGIRPLVAGAAGLGAGDANIAVLINDERFVALHAVIADHRDRLPGRFAEERTVIRLAGLQVGARLAAGPVETRTDGEHAVVIGIGLHAIEAGVAGVVGHVADLAA